MEPMSLKAAIDIAAKFTTKLEWTQLVQLCGDFVRASSVEAGCEIPVRGLPPTEVYAEAGRLRQMMGAIGDGAQVRIVGKGRTAKLEIKGGGSTFTLQIIDGKGHPGFPVIPDTGWFGVPDAQSRAIAAAASLVDDEATGGTYATSGVRLGNGKAFGLVQWGGIRVELPAATCAPTTIQKVAFGGLRGALEVAVIPGRAYVREPATGQVRWTATLDGAYPDAVFDDAVRAVVPVAGIRVSAAELGLLCRQAVVAEGFGFRLAVEEGRLTLRSSTATAGPTAFDGGMAGEVWLAGVAEIGVQPTKLGATVAAVALAAGVEQVDVVLGGPSSPMLIRVGDVATAVMMAVRL